MPTIIEIDSDEEDIQPEPTINNSLIQQENNEGEMSESETEELSNSEATQNQEEVTRHDEMPMRRNTIQGKNV